MGWLAITWMLLGCGDPEEAALTDLQSYYDGLDDTCTTDTDCAILNEGNCCGYYPACLNAGAAVDSNAVREICAAGELGGVCGYPEIAACACVENTCVEAAR